jgi:hypothetical protein
VWKPTCEFPGLLPYCPTSTPGSSMGTAHHTHHCCTSFSVTAREKKSSIYWGVPRHQALARVPLPSSHCQGTTCFEQENAALVNSCNQGLHAQPPWQGTTWPHLPPCPLCCCCCRHPRNTQQLSTFLLSSLGTRGSQRGPGKG